MDHNETEATYACCRVPWNSFWPPSPKLVPFPLPRIAFFVFVFGCLPLHNQRRSKLMNARLRKKRLFVAYRDHSLRSIDIFFVLPDALLSTLLNPTNSSPNFMKQPQAGPRTSLLSNILLRQGMGPSTLASRKKETCHASIDFVLAGVIHHPTLNHFYKAIIISVSLFCINTMMSQYGIRSPRISTVNLSWKAANQRPFTQSWVRVHYRIPVASCPHLLRTIQLNHFGKFIEHRSLQGTRGDVEIRIPYCKGSTFFCRNLSPLLITVHRVSAAAMQAY